MKEVFAMLRLLIAGFAVLVLAVNLMVIDYTLRITNANTSDVISKLTHAGLIAVLLGAAIFVVGFIRGFRKNLSPETSAIFTAGSSMFVIGASTVIRAIGHDYETAVKYGAWAAAGMGFIMVMIYAIHQYIQIRNSNN